MDQPLSLRFLQDYVESIDDAVLGAAGKWETPKPSLYLYGPKFREESASKARQYIPFKISG